MQKRNLKDAVIAIGFVVSMCSGASFGQVGIIGAESSVNYQPYADAQAVTTTAIQPVAFVLEGADPDDDALTYAIVDSPTGGTISSFDANTGEVTYLPGAGVTGTDIVTFKTTDGLLDSEVAVVEVSVLPDADVDGIDDSVDNCTNLANADQRDTDADGFGNRCDGDFNNDCIVNPIDLGIFRSVFFTTDPDGDLSGDGIVNPIDLGIFRSLFFMPPGPSSVACIP